MAATCGTGWVSRTIGSDLGLGIFPVEDNLGTCPHCMMRWSLAWGLAGIDPRSRGPVTLKCTRQFGGCGKSFVLLHWNGP